MSVKVQGNHYYRLISGSRGGQSSIRMNVSALREETKESNGFGKGGRRDVKAEPERVLRNETYN